jgi:peptidyl-tRNA hydrolase, PTH1 family
MPMDPPESGIVGRGLNSESRLVVGLGNPTARYARTRHNLGFRVLDALARRPATAGAGDYLQQEWTVDGTRVICVRPLTYMNRSGIAVAQASQRFDLPAEHCLIVVDDATRDLGRLRLRTGGSAGGHNGLKSVEEYLQTQDYPRLKMGCGPGPEGDDLADWVLGEFTEEEEKEVEAMVERACDAVTTWILHGAEETMARFNG